MKLRRVWWEGRSLKSITRLKYAYRALIGAALAVPASLLALYSDVIRSKLDAALKAADFWHVTLTTTTLALLIGAFVLVGLLIRLSEQNAILLAKLDTDAKSGLASYDALKQSFESDYLPRVQNDESFAVLMLDLKDFKEINNRYGHVAGDDIIAAVGGFLKHTVREDDLPVRYGEAADEFFVILQGGTADAFGFGLRLRKDLKYASSKSFPHLSQKGEKLDFWACSTLVDKRDSWSDILDRLSKQLGKNKEALSDEITDVRRAEETSVSA